MPVTFRIDESSGAILTTARGIVPYLELFEHIESKTKRNLITRAELFDARDTTLDLSLAELRGLAERVKEALGSRPQGRVAVVTNSAFVYGLARAYASLTRTENPQFQIFQDMDKALEWIRDNTSE